MRLVTSEKKTFSFNTSLGRFFSPNQWYFTSTFENESKQNRNTIDRIKLKEKISCSFSFFTCSSWNHLLFLFVVFVAVKFRIVLLKFYLISRKYYSIALILLVEHNFFLNS